MCQNTSRGLGSKNRRETSLSKKYGQQFDSVMMVPVTPGGELKKIIDEKAKKANLKIKLVEKAGQKLSTYLRKFDKTNSKNRP